MLNNVSILLGLILVLNFQVPFQLTAQEGDEFVLIDATLFTNSGDTIEGKILYTNHYNFQFNVPLSDTGGNVLAYYTPKELSGFTYSLKEDNFYFLSKDNPDGAGKVFLRVLYQGRISVYQFLELNTKYYSFNTLFYLWDEKWLEPPIRPEFDRRALLHHFSGCPELEYKIKTGEYGFSQIKKILQEYEDCKLTDEYEFFY